MGSSSHIPLTLLLKEQSRTPQAIEQVKSRSEKLGLDITSHGRASLTARIPLKLFKALFDRAPTGQRERPASERDFGAPEGYREDDGLPVPRELADLVELITIEPPATRLGSSTFP
jgi:hypothetical protein